MTIKTPKTRNAPRRSARCFQRDSSSGNVALRTLVAQGSAAGKCHEHLAAVGTESQASINGASSSAGEIPKDSKKKRKRSSMDYEDIIQKTVDPTEKAVDAFSNIVHGISAESGSQNSTLDSWKDDNSMFEIVEAALMALKRAEKLPERSEFLEIAQQRYKKALADYKKMSGISY